VGLAFDYEQGQTPLDEEEKEGLIIKTIASRTELDEFEQLNIEEAVQWSLARKFTKEVLFTERYIKEIHRKMYRSVWAWSGQFRQTNKNIGVDRWQISVQLKNLLGDVLFWSDNFTYPPDEIAVRFKHRLVSIHCFPNGNGRHSRLMADIIIEKIFGEKVFTWGSGNLLPAGNARTAYLDALKKADSGNYSALIAFARS